MKDKLNALKAKPWVAHLLRAWTRFGNRLGNQFAAAITYFSVLALVPILMFAFSMLGMTVTVLRPALLDTVTRWLTRELGDAGAGQQIAGLVEDFLANWRGVGIVGLLSLLYAGSGWVGNLRSAVNAQWRPEFEHKEDTRNIVVATLSNMGVLLVLLIGVLTTLTVSVVGQAMTHTIASWLDIADWPGGHLLLRLGAFLVALLAAWLLFLLLFTILPADHAMTRAKMVGAVMGAFFFAVVQLAAGGLMAGFKANKAAAVFGPVIVVMLVMNLFARVILLVTSWIATDKQPAVAFHYNECDEPLRLRDDAVTADDHWRLADEERAQQKAEKAEADREKKPVPAPDPSDHFTVSRPRRQERYRPPLVSLEDYPRPDPNRQVTETVAARSVRAGMKAGWAVGVGTGVGLGAAITTLLRRLRS